MMVVPDVDEMFMPLLDGFFVKPSEAEEVIDNLMLQVRFYRNFWANLKILLWIITLNVLLLQIPEMFGRTRETEIVLGPIIQAGINDEDRAYDVITT